MKINSRGMIGRPIIQIQRASIMCRTRGNGVPVYVAQVRQPGGERVYLGRHPSRELGLLACGLFMSFGVKPDASKRSPKVGEKTARPAKQTPAQRPVDAKADRLEMLRMVARRFE